MAYAGTYTGTIHTYCDSFNYTDPITFTINDSGYIDLPFSSQGTLRDGTIDSSGRIAGISITVNSLSLGTVTIPYAASDDGTHFYGTGTSSNGITSVIQATLVPVNHAPVAVSGTGSVFAGFSIDRTAGVNGTGVLAGASDPDGDALTVLAVQGGSVGQTFAGRYGHLLLNADGSYSYAADNAASTSSILHDRFTYTVSDGHGGTASASLDISIEPHGANYGDTRYVFGTLSTDSHSLGAQVYALYDGLLGRAPDPIGLEHWAAQFSAGVSPTVLADAFLSSPEGQARSGAADNGAFLTQLYQATLHRAPDQVGFDHWLAELNGGTSRGTVGAGFALSPEHLGSIQPALNAGLFVGDEITSAVARIYYTVLDRAPDATGLAYWSSVVHSGTSLTAQTAAFLQAPEVQGLIGNMSTAQFVDFVYENALGRHAEPTGLAAWVDRIDHGGSRVDVTTAIGQSAEAQQHLLPLIEQGWHLT